jgi:hypothetical protein
MSLNGILGGLLKVLQFWKRGHDAGLWDKGQGPAHGPAHGRTFDPGKPTHAERMGRGFGVLLATGLSLSCGAAAQVYKDCRVTPCGSGEVCERPTDGTFTWLCKPAPEPSPRPWPENPVLCFDKPGEDLCDCYQTSSLSANLCTYKWCDGHMEQATCPTFTDCRKTGCTARDEECRLVARDGTYSCVKRIVPTPPPPPPPTTLPPPPPPSPGPSPCVATQQTVCVASEGGTVLGIFDPKAQSGPTACWTCKDWLAFMMRDRWDDACQCIKAGSAQFTTGDPTEDGDVGGHPGFWMNYAYGQLVGLIGKKDCRNPNGRLVIDPPFTEKRALPCATPTPPPPSPPPGPTPTPPPPGVIACTPHSHTGVALHDTKPAPNGPRGIRWVFSATNKSTKPFCPPAFDQNGSTILPLRPRSECEQQGYRGDPVGDYEHVQWFFEERFRCQAASGPPDWAQQEPHTGQNWERTDVRDDNAWMANLKPAVPGLHTVRVCVRGTSNCRTTTAVAP